MENRGRSLLLVSLLCGCSLTLYATAAYAGDAALISSGFDWSKLAGFSGAAVAFLTGLQATNRRAPSETQLGDAFVPLPPSFI
jgi:hypothetical protein